MYQVGDRLVYGVHGVCQVAREEQRRVDGKELTYLALEPVGQRGTCYLVPTQNTSAMRRLRPLQDRDAMEQMLLLGPTLPDAWIPEEPVRKQRYREFIAGAEGENLVRMICALYRHRERQRAAGKKCHVSDENFLRDAEKLLSGELGDVYNALDFTPSTVEQVWAKLGGVYTEIQVASLLMQLSMQKEILQVSPGYFCHKG